LRNRQEDFAQTIAQLAILSLADKTAAYGIIYLRSAANHDSVEARTSSKSTDEQKVEEICHDT